MAITRADIERFFSTLILGDFEENQSASAQVVGGLISMIPILDQVMDARDITGSLFRINKQGGFAAATPDQLANLGFAAFGAVPFVGSAFKTAFKPLWRQRHTAGGMVSGGLEAVESLLRLEKGGAIRWIRMELLGKWSDRTAQAVLAVEAAMDSCIALLDFIADAAGWRDWLIPDTTQDLARQALPGMRTMRGQIRAPLERGSNEIREFLEDLIGEQAASVVMAAGGRAVVASAVPGTRSRSGRNAAAVRPQGQVPPRQPPREVGGSATTQSRRGGGSVHPGIQRTRAAFSDLANAAVGVLGEHIADYHCADNLGWGRAWSAHDRGNAGTWSTPPNAQNQGKLSNRTKLFKLSITPHGTGIDAVWRAGGQNDGKRYAIVEAKATLATKRIDGTRRPSIAGTLGVTGRQRAEAILDPVTDEPAGSGRGTATPAAAGRRGRAGAPRTSTAPTTPSGRSATVTVQMSREWIEMNLRPAVGRVLAAEIGRLTPPNTYNYSRHLFYTPISLAAALEHATALTSGTAEDRASHVDHNIPPNLHYDESAVKRAVNLKKANLNRAFRNGQPLVQEP